MVAEPASHSASGSAPIKRQLFNKPIWSKPQALTNSNDLFHRSSQTYVGLAAEAERQRKRKLARKDRERVRQAAVEERAEKRQRVSESEDDEDDDTSTDEGSHKSECGEGVTGSKHSESRTGLCALSTPKPSCSPTSLLKRYEATIAATERKVDSKQKAPASQIIDLEDEDEDDTSPVIILRDSVTNRATNAKQPLLPEEENEVVSDDEFPELARQAREMARRQRLEKDIVSKTPGPSLTRRDDYQQRSQPTKQPTPTPPPPDPVLDILITSDIPDTEPLIVKRKLSQRLKDVKVAWAERQHFTQDFTDSVFLVWRGKRIFDHTTCRSLGYKAGPNGRIMASRDSMMDDEGRIHMEVMTRELFEKYKQAKITETREEEKESGQETAAEEQKQEVQVKIVCKAKGFPDFKLIVKPVGTQVFLGVST